MTYEVGDTVWVQSEEFIKGTGDRIGQNYNYIGGSDNDLYFNQRMFKYCGCETKVKAVKKINGYLTYYLDITIDHRWTPEMLTKIEPGTENAGIKEVQESQLQFREDLL